MPSRRRKTAGNKVTAQAGPEPESQRPQAAQVVEIIEEEVDSAPVASMTEEPPVQEPEPQPIAADTKTMVEELYTPERNASAMPEISVHKNNSGKPLVIWALVTIIVALITGGILFAANKKSVMPTLFARATPTPTPAPTVTPTPTPATVDKKSFDIQVLNGGGTPGAASKMKKFLEDKGYKVASTGNTPDYTYDTTEIHGKTGETDAVANLKADLKDTYSLGTVDTNLDASSSADVQVIVGKE